MSRETQHIALMQARPLPSTEEGQVPDWVHLLPGGSAILTRDGRGPYRVPDPAAVIAASLDGGKLPIDENHAIDLAAPHGDPSPARGHIVELQARADGIWGRVEWTGTGRALLVDRAYLGLSPAISHTPQGQVLRILSASLVNRPNLRGLTALHQEESMSLMQRLAELLGLDAAAGEEALVERVTALHQQAGQQAAPELTALQSQLTEIGVALGVAGDAAPEAIVAAARAAKGGETATIVALQSEITDLTTRFNTLSEATAREKAAAFVDGEIRKGRVSVKPLRDHYISMHMQDAARVEKEIGAMPILGPGPNPAPVVPQTALQSEDPNAIAAQARTYQKKLADGGIEIDFASAVIAIKEGKS